MSKVDVVAVYIFSWEPGKVGKVSFIYPLNSYNISDMGTIVKTVAK